ncbi:hypothetical protein BH11PLA2_BH11PLA2_49770 [soil metagenome]
MKKQLLQFVLTLFFTLNTLACYFLVCRLLNEKIKRAHPTNSEISFPSQELSDTCCLELFLFPIILIFGIMASHKLALKIVPPTTKH